MLSGALMVQGTTSDAGKSTLVAAICRVLANQEISVAPFKPQNMALNSAVTEDAGEIGRAQALQAEACRIKPHTDMNPVLIKPASDIGAQIIIQGKALGDMDAQAFHQYKPRAKAAVLQSFSRLCDQFQAVVVEGAGSPAEINLRDGDIANMGFAEATDCSVIIIADIDKGGVFAHLVGTLELLSPSEQARVKGFVINKFRGDIALLQPGLDWLEERTKKPVLGVLPYLHDLYLDAEDAINASQGQSDNKQRFNVVVPVLPRISNHTDFDALRLNPGVNLIFAPITQKMPAADLIVLPGSKNVRADLAALIEHRWDKSLRQHLRYGGKVMGICGGWQMLGELINDPKGIEGEPGSCEGLGFFPAVATLASDKTLAQKKGTLLCGDQSVPVTGYEIHHGVTEFLPSTQLAPVIQFDDGSVDGFFSDDGQLFGCYLHGIFDYPDACDALLAWAGFTIEKAHQSAINLEETREQQLERLASIAQQHLDFAKIINVMGLESVSSYHD